MSIDDFTGLPNKAPPPRAPEGGRPSLWRKLRPLAVGGLLAAALVAGSIALQPGADSPAPQPPAVEEQAAPEPAPEQAAPAKPRPAPTPRELRERRDERVARSLERIAESLDEQAAAQRRGSSSWSSGFLGMIVNIVLFVLAFFFISRWLNRKLGGGGASSGQPQAQNPVKLDVEKPAQRFTDVEGVDENLVNLQEIVSFMRDPSRFRRMGGKLPKGILFEGPPGTGKTLMARALAGESNAAFFAVSGSDFVEVFVGLGARRVRELIEKAAKNKPAVVFIDEIDAVGKQRGANAAGSESEREQTLNQLLASMDGFDNSGGIIFVAATNRAELLDSALTRPGRFDRKIHVGKPHLGGREAILTIHAKGKRLAPEADLRLAARRTAGLAGADLENVMNEAALLALRRGADAIGPADIDKAIDAGTIGAERSLPMPEAVKRRVAYHEAGHALANLLHEDPALRGKVNKFTIVPHGSGALGFAEFGSPEGDEYLHTRAELEARLDHALGGLVAEKLVFGKEEAVPERWSPDWSTGPGSDLKHATDIARMMVQALGMGAETGLAVTAPDERDPLGRPAFGDAVGARAWREVNKLLDASMRRVAARLSRNRHVLEALVKAVLEKETLLGEEIDDVVRKAGPAGSQNH